MLKASVALASPYKPEEVAIAPADMPIAGSHSEDLQVNYDGVSDWIFVISGIQTTDVDLSSLLQPNTDYALRGELTALGDSVMHLAIVDVTPDPTVATFNTMTPLGPFSRTFTTGANVSTVAMNIGGQNSVMPYRISNLRISLIA